MSHRDVGVTFDLEPDDDAGAEGNRHGLGAVPDEPEVDALADPVRHGARAVRAFVARQPRRRLVAVGVGIALVAGSVVGGTFAVRAAQAAAAERDRVAALLASPGGVLDLGSGPLEEAWSVPLTGAVLGTLSGTLAGTVVVADGADAVGLRVDDGGEAWRHELGGDLTCGLRPMPGERAPTPTTLVCLAGPVEARRVTVLDADGVVVARRDLGDTTDRSVVPTADGGLLTVRPTGEVPELPVTPAGIDLSETFPQGILAGPDALLEMTDAASGALRWTAEVPFEPGAYPLGCGPTIDVDGSTRITLSVGAYVTPTLIVIDGCGVDAAFLPDGTLLAGREDLDQAYLQPDPDGGYVLHGYAAPSQVLDERGGLRSVVNLGVVVPTATDAVSANLLVLDGNGTLLCLDADGQRLWPASPGATSPPAVSSVLVRAGGVVLGLTRDWSLVGLDANDGTLLWQGDRDTRVPEYGTDAAVTDGTVAVLAVAADQSATPERHLVGVDLRTGRTWTLDREHTAMAELLVVDGALVEYATGTATEVRDLPNGEAGWFRDGTLTRLTPPAP
ncbi:PQQ-binding-like beta-propeller repeat protein [Xylanimonas cellulosilytica]|uniref:outer membrane protein assembly factor BamB family protein n=1 Tax=Xylanimonas cellulosilytica TaxID=186189 RepID=UPI000301561A|nr:PQQ-binding-like beta-propeller repeat protein [Xylanimonas cellulosilytica]